MALANVNVPSTEKMEYSAGDNITITGGKISAKNTTYTAGSNMTIDSSNKISGTANTTYSVATTSSNGLMSASDKTKLNKLPSTVAAGLGIAVNSGTISVSLSTVSSTADGAMWIEV